jgi:hypothetical protein
MASLSPALVAFCAHIARNVPSELVLPTTPEQGVEEVGDDALQAAFPRVRGVFLLPVWAVVIALAPETALAVFGGIVGVVMFRELYYGGAYRHRLRGRLLELCLKNHLPPRALATWAAEQPFWSRPRPYAELIDDVVLDAAYALGRFADLLGKS